MKDFKAELYIEQVNKTRIQLTNAGNSFTLMELHQALVRAGVPVGNVPITTAMKKLEIVKSHCNRRYHFEQVPIYKLKFQRAYELALDLKRKQN